jgi:hypothetical protein
MCEKDRRGFFCMTVEKADAESEEMTTPVMEKKQKANGFVRVWSLSHIFIF